MMEMQVAKKMLELIVKPQFKYVRNSLLYCMPKTKKNPFWNCLQQKDDQTG